MFLLIIHFTRPFLQPHDCKQMQFIIGNSKHKSTQLQVQLWDKL